MKIQRLIRLILAVLTVLSWPENNPLAAAAYEEPWRPKFHFTPEKNWMNDPNGMVFYDGEYHLFYQYNPFGDKWGHMSWGHAVSPDLVRWKHLPLALSEEAGVMIFSGSALVDWNNSSGLGRGGKPPLIAIYTGHHTEKPLQNQHIAYSNDRGRTWTKYAGNPVLDIGEKDFRDPKVFWHQPSERWIMTVAWPTHRKVRFYASPNLTQWTHLSDFGPAGSTTGIWECPDLFPIQIEGRPGRQAWMLVVNVGSGAPAGGSGCQYFPGHFDGRQFSADPRSLPTGTHDGGLWADWGRDFYAAVSWSDVPKSDGRRLWLGWMSNWEYAQDVPTQPWRSAMTIPRVLALRPTPDGLRLLQQPVRELATLRQRHHRLRRTSIAAANEWLAGRSVDSDALEIKLELAPSHAGDRVALRLRTAETEETSITCDLATSRLVVDRTHAGRSDFHPRFSGVHAGPLRLVNGRVRLHVFCDTSSVEVFANEGESVLSALRFPVHGTNRLELAGTEESGHRTVRSLDVWTLRSAWR